MSWLSGKLLGGIHLCRRCRRFDSLNPVVGVLWHWRATRAADFASKLAELFCVHADVSMGDQWLNP